MKTWGNLRDRSLLTYGIVEYEAASRRGLIQALGSKSKDLSPWMFFSARSSATGVNGVRFVHYGQYCRATR